MICRGSVHHCAVIALAVAAGLFLALSANEAQAADHSLVVHTTDGQVQGAARPDGGAEFLGIPYAQPPVGALRWHEPVSPKPWSGVRNTTEFGAPCKQPVLGDWNKNDAEHSSEDCLYLNVISAEWPVKKPLPVMFWIHGGGNEGGTASSDLYKDGTLVNHGVLLVTVNYRLGVFGFLADPELTREAAHGESGNYGLMDQILALEWVHANIARFGGDPNNITVFGQSAGAMDTGMLMTSRAKGLFQKAIAESGSPFVPPLAPLAEAEKTGEKLGEALNVPAGTDRIKYLRGISADDLLADIAKLNPKDRPRVNPDVDGWVLQRSPASVFAAGQEAAIPLILGTTTREFGGKATPDELRSAMAKMAGPLTEKLEAAYGLANGGQGTSSAKYGTTSDQWPADMVFRCPATAESEWHSKAHHPTYEYEFDHAIPGQPNAVHSSDLPYVFGYFPKTGNIAGHFGETDTRLADLMETYWTNFAKTGNPNSDHLARWQRFGTAQNFIQFMEDGSVVPATKLRGAQCRVFREVMADHVRHGN